VLTRYSEIHAGQIEGLSTRILSTDKIRAHISSERRNRGFVAQASLRLYSFAGKIWLVPFDIESAFADFIIDAAIRAEEEAAKLEGREPAKLVSGLLSNLYLF
jgi:hypothetical protein